MSIEFDPVSDGWDRTLLDLSSKMSEPFVQAWSLLRFRLVTPLDPQKFDNCSSRVLEVGIRILIVFGAAIFAYLCFAFPIPMLCTVAILAVGGKVLRAIGFALQKQGYTHVRGKAPEKSLDPQDPKIKLKNWNILGITGLSRDHGGCIDWRPRLDRIVEAIELEDPDVLVLEEIYDTALAEALIEKLSHRYAHFFLHLGANTIASVGGGMVLSKLAVHNFSNTSFVNNSWKVNRTIAELEVKASPSATEPCARIIGTHLIDGETAEGRKNRQIQVAQIVDSLAQKTFSLPTFFLADTNIKRDSEEGKILTDVMRHGYLGSEETCTIQLLKQWDKENNEIEGIIDCVSLFKRVLPDGRVLCTIEEGVTFEDCHLYKAYDEKYDTRTALSDHQGVVATVRIPLLTTAHKVNGAALAAQAA